jgi:D-alanyl-D-alanine carboxypeptidase
MRVSIIPADNMVVIDGKAMFADLKVLRGRNVSAVQWFDRRGEVEFVGHAQQNQVITSLKMFQEFIDLARTPPDPRSPTPSELEAQNRAYIFRNPEARRAWDEQDAAQRREAEARAALEKKGQEAAAARSAPK